MMSQKTLGAVLVLALLVALAGCAGTPRSKPPSPVPGQPRAYHVNGKWYQPLASADGYSETGLASWYGRKFHGRPTSSGERYDMYGLSAAHKTLPLHTWVRVDNLENGRQMDLRINDRGPFVDGRVIDLSYGAAQRLGVDGPGTARVRLTALGRRLEPDQPGQAPSYAPMDYTHGNFTFQVGAFQDPANAHRLRDRLAAEHPNVHVQTYFHADHGQLYAVRLGRATSLEEAADYKARLRAGQFPEAFIVAE
jgi:rare lipoprotein A